MPIEYRIRSLTEHDLAAACQLELAAGLGTLGEAGLRARLSNPFALLLGAFQSSDNEPATIIAEHSAITPITPIAPMTFTAPAADNGSAETLVGLFSGWVVVDEMEIDNLVVAARARQQGIGRALLAEALQQAWQRGARYAFLEVRENNLAALALYQSAGFTQAGRRRGYYHNPVEDALRLRLELTQSPVKLKLRLS